MVTLMMGIVLFVYCLRGSAAVNKGSNQALNYVEEGKERKNETLPV
jgi:hypothetical protein